jgi:hypothetical protein
MAAACGAAIRTANWVGVRPTRSTASRLVRLDTGSSRLAVLASQTVSIASGTGGMPALPAVASITGVSSTAVVSRFKKIVVAEAKRTHNPNSVR